MIMKQTLIRIVLLIVAFGTPIYSASAFDFSSVSSSGQTLYYTIMSDSTVSVVYPNQVGNSYYSGYASPSGNVVIPASVAHSGNVYSVVAIGDYAFYGCKSLTNVVIRGDLKRIGEGAFWGCEKLKRPVSLPSTELGENAFGSWNR